MSRYCVIGAGAAGVSALHQLRAAGHDVDCFEKTHRVGGHWHTDYDALHLMTLAIAKAGSTEGPKVREAFYALDKYEGLIKTYNKPFTPANRDALTSDDYIFTYFKEGEILPLTN